MARSAPCGRDRHAPRRVPCGFCAVTRDHLRRIRPRGSFVVVVVMSRPGVGPKGARRQNERRLGALPVATQQLRKKIDRPNYGEVKRGP